MQNFDNIDEEMLRRNNPNNMYNLINMNDTNSTSYKGNSINNFKNFSNALPKVNEFDIEKTRVFKLVYPDIYYKLQPYIMMVCDQMDTYNEPIPNQIMIEDMTDSIYDDVLRMFPDISEYVKEERQEIADTESIPAQITLGRRRNSRPRGLFKDLIDILFLTELLRRRKRY